MKKSKRSEKKHSKGNYIFPNYLAKMMEKVDLRTQYEGSLMSLSLLLIGLIITGIYLAIWGGMPLWYKIVLVVNVFAGFLFMSSFLVTTFQQYKQYINVKQFQESIREENEKCLEKSKKMK